jgi:signal transduction histidine kinase
LFARGELSSERAVGGLGVGLTLVRRLAELHGGRVEALSDGPNHGSTFIVRLPRIAAPVAESSRVNPRCSRHRHRCSWLPIEQP